VEPAEHVFDDLNLDINEHMMECSTVAVASAVTAAAEQDSSSRIVTNYGLPRCSMHRAILQVS
jgi:hypothetical protein